MDNYFISFPAAALAGATEEQLAAASTGSRCVVDEAKAAGVWIFGGAINTDVAPETVHGDGVVTSGAAATRELDGGFAILRSSSIEDARTRAEKFATALGCPQELRAIHYHSDS